ncbi:MAG: ABC transporter permease [Candidatus Dormibacteraeota bacterium]|nr:ABC transporter permease [Candidatus Dormibacteraeota bacterium]
MSQVTAPPATVAPLGRMMVSQVKSVLIVYSRQLGFVAISVFLPIMFFLFFGLPNVGQTSKGFNVGAYILASLGTYAVSNVVVYNVGIGVATQRGRKFDLLQRATPLPPFIAILGNVVGGLALSLLSLIGLFIVAAIGGVHMAFGTWIALLAWLVVACLPMVGLGLTIGYGASPNSAPAVASLVYLPIAFASGLFIPLPNLPSFIRGVAQYLPLYHEGELGWITIGAGDESRLAAVAWVLGWSIVLLSLAARAYRSDAQKKFG